MKRPLCVLLALLAFPVAAQNYPARIVRTIVPFPAGGSTDALARMVSQQLNESYGQLFIVEDRPGATGTIAGALVAKSAPDGYTLLFGTGGGTFLAPLMLPKVPYDPHRDFAPVSMLVQSPQVLVVHPSVAANSVSGLVALAKAKPGALVDRDAWRRRRLRCGA